MIEFTTTSPIQTKKIASALAKEILKTSPDKGALVLALEGNLGAGKTTFVQGFARGLGIKEIPKSPTFVLINTYLLGKSEIRSTKFETNLKFQNPKNKKMYGRLIHIDCYRIASPKEFAHLGIKEIFKDPRNIVVIEWAERIKSLLPRNVIRVHFEHGKKINERVLQISNS